MNTFFRKHQHTLMVMITIMVIIAFVFLYNHTRFDQLDRNKVGTFHGQTVTMTDVQRDGKNFNLALELGLIDMVQSLAGYSQEPQESFLWNSMVLGYEADRLDLNPTDAEIADALKKVSVFQTNGMFDPQKFAAFNQNSLAPRGVLPAQLEEVVRLDLRLKRLRSLLESAVDLPPEQARDLYTKQQAVVDLGVVRISSADLRKTVQISDADLQAAFAARQETLKTPELRKVKVAELMLSAAEQKLPPKEKVDALQKLSDKANEFTQGILEPKADFDALAAKLEVPVKETAPFSADKPDPMLAETSAAATAAFALTAQDPNSDPIQTTNGFVILRLVDTVAPRPLTFDEARAQLTEAITTDRTREMLDIKGAEVRKKIEAELQTGKSFADAAQAAGQTAEMLSLSPTEPDPKQADAPTILQTASQLDAKGLSDLVPSPDGSLLVYLVQRQPIDPAKIDQELDRFTKFALRQRREVVFQEWLRLRREEAKIM